MMNLRKFPLLHSLDKYGKLIRSKGYFWLATRPEYAGQWSQAGGIAHYGFAGMFWKAIPKKIGPLMLTIEPQSTNFG